jgi:hypothetical protein
VAHGYAREAEIDAELERDPTSTGQRQAERARALIPTADAKERAWTRAVHDDDIPNAVQEAIISGFSHPIQRGLLGGYVERYFGEVAEVWSRRTSERAQQVVVGLFPSWAVDKSTVEAADAWLADESHPPALRRLVSEGRAGIVRALGAREFARIETTATTYLDIRGLDTGRRWGAGPTRPPDTGAPGLLGHRTAGAYSTTVGRAPSAAARASRTSGSFGVCRPCSPASTCRDVIGSARPQETNWSKAVMSGSTFRANPWLLTPPRIRIPIEAILRRSGVHTPTRLEPPGGSACGRRGSPVRPGRR